MPILLTTFGLLLVFALIGISQANTLKEASFVNQITLSNFEDMRTSLESALKKKTKEVYAKYKPKNPNPANTPHSTEPPKLEDDDNDKVSSDDLDKADEPLKTIQRTSYLHIEALLLDNQPSDKQKASREILQRLIHNLYKNEQFYKETIEDDSSSGKSLVFTFKERSRNSETTSSVVLGKLYVENDELCLMTWPHPKEIAKELTVQPRKEVLLKKVSSFKIELFKAPKIGAKKQGDEPIPTKKWVDHWPISYKARPSLVHIECNLCDFWFIIAREIEPVVYGGE